MTQRVRDEILPVIPLGHSGTRHFFYFVRVTRQIVRLSSGAHTPANFLAMAMEPDWLNWPGVRLGQHGIDWSSLSEILMGECREKGIYDPDCARGRGAWRDGTDVVFHAGDTIYVNGEETQFDNFHSSEFRYVAAVKAMRPSNEAATAKDGEELISTLNTWGWDQTELAPKLVLGWIGCALICGALSWRPHMWITGTKGSGKSTLDDLISNLLGNLALHIQGNTTEPGLRQALNGDARPILFDEFEADNRTAAAVIDAARAAASDNSAVIAKGSSDGKPNLFRLRFSALFSGIIANVHREADRSRIVFLEIHAVERDEEQRRAFLEARKRFDTDFGGALLRRMLDALNSRRFDDTLAKFRIAIRLLGGDERKADVFGQLLAAHHVLTSDDNINEMEARPLAALISKLDEGEPSDEDACISHLLGYRLKVEREYDRTIGEWILFALEYDIHSPPRDAVLAELERHGIKKDGSSIKIANHVTGIKRVFYGTRWAAGGHWRIIRRLPDAQPGGNAWFAGEQSKCTVVPITSLIPPADYLYPPDE